MDDAKLETTGEDASEEPEAPQEEIVVRTDGTEVNIQPAVDENPQPEQPAEEESTNDSVNDEARAGGGRRIDDPEVERSDDAA